MKKNLLVLVLGIVLLGVQSCQKEDLSVETERLEQVLPGEWDVTRYETKAESDSFWKLETGNEIERIIDISTTHWGIMPYSVSQRKIYIYSNTSPIYTVTYLSDDQNRIELHQVSNDGFETKLFLHRRN